MARRKFTPKSQAVVPKAKPGPWGRPRSAKTEIKHPIYDLRGMSERAHAKARARARFRASVANFRANRITYGGRFLRYFSMFLVCLVLLSVVTDASYDTYQVAVNTVYETTEAVSSFVNSAVEALRSTTQFIGNIKDIRKLEHGDQVVVSVKIKGSYYRFLCVAEYLGSDWGGVAIKEAYDGYSKWVGKRFEPFLGWLKCPDFGIRVYHSNEYIGE